MAPPANCTSGLRPLVDNRGLRPQARQKMTTPTDYPLPEHAAYIWTNGEKIILTFPGYQGTEDRRFNSVHLDPKDPASLFNSSLEGNTRRAIDFREGEKINEKALKDLVRAAVALNESKGKRR